MSEEDKKIRADIDNKTIAMLQAGSGGGVLAAVATLPKLLEVAPNASRTIALFIALNALAFVLAVIANISRRRTSLVHEKHRKIENSTSLNPAISSKRDWVLIWLSTFSIGAAYAVLVCALWAWEKP